MSTTILYSKTRLNLYNVYSSRFATRQDPNQRLTGILKLCMSQVDVIYFLRANNKSSDQTGEVWYAPLLFARNNQLTREEGHSILMLHMIAYLRNIFVYN